MSAAAPSPKSIPRFLTLVGVMIAGGLLLKACETAKHQSNNSPVASVASATVEVPTIPEEQKCSHFLPGDQWSKTEAPVGQKSDPIEIPTGMEIYAYPTAASGEYSRTCTDGSGSEVACEIATKVQYQSSHEDTAVAIQYRLCRNH